MRRRRCGSQRRAGLPHPPGGAAHIPRCLSDRVLSERGGRRAAFALTLALHGSILWALLQRAPPRPPPAETVTVVVDLVVERPSVPVEAPAPRVASPPAPSAPQPAPPEIEATPEVEELPRIREPPEIEQPPVRKARTQKRRIPREAAVSPAPPPVLPMEVSAPRETPLVVPAPAAAESVQPPAKEPASAAVGGLVPDAAVSPPQYDAAYLRNPPPAYPALSRRFREEGRVLLRVFVGATGAAERVELQASSGSQRLDRAAEEAVRDWRFTPARQADKAVAAWVEVPVVFRLER